VSGVFLFFFVGIGGIDDHQFHQYQQKKQKNTTHLKSLILKQ
jgi:hypothetical protein